MLKARTEEEEEEGGKDRPDVPSSLSLSSVSAHFSQGVMGDGGGVGAGEAQQWGASPWLQTVAIARENLGRGMGKSQHAS